MTSTDLLLGFTGLFMLGVFVVVLALLRFRRENERLREIVASYEERDRGAGAAKRTSEPPSAAG